MTKNKVHLIRKKKNFARLQNYKICQVKEKNKAELTQRLEW